MIPTRRVRVLASSTRAASLLPVSNVVAFNALPLPLGTRKWSSGAMLRTTDPTIKLTTGKGPRGERLCQLNSPESQAFRLNTSVYNQKGMRSLAVTKKYCLKRLRSRCLKAFPTRRGQRRRVNGWYLGSVQRASWERGEGPPLPVRGPYGAGVGVIRKGFLTATYANWILTYSNLIFIHFDLIS